MDTQCQDFARNLLFQRLGQYLLREEPLRAGTCSICGARGVAVKDEGKKADVAPCQAQMSLTQKRHTAAEGHPIAFGSPLHEPGKRGGVAVADTGVAVLIEPERTIFVGKVLPLRQTPDWLEIVRPGAGTTIASLVERVMLDPRPPYLLVSFQKKADMPLVMSNTADEIIINGTTAPVRLDRSRLADLVALVEEFGAAAVLRARDVRRAWGAGKPGYQAEVRKLARSQPELLDRLDDLPSGDENEFLYARFIASRRAKARQQEDAPEADAFAA